jgi:hypothetical protein
VTIEGGKKVGEFGEKWFQESRMADSTRAMRRSIYERDILPTFRSRLLTEIAPDDLRLMCGKVKDRGAPATAVHVRDIVKLIFAFAILHGEKVANPADELGLRRSRPSYRRIVCYHPRRSASCSVSLSMYRSCRL